MAMTPDSFTENETYDILVTIYLIVRIVVSSLMSLVCGYQTIIEIRTSIQIYKKKFMKPRINTLISLTMFPLFRVLYSIAVFITHNFDYGSLSIYFGMWTTLFIFNIWIWISCVWQQLLYTFFISKEIIFENNRRIYKMSWFISFLALAYTISFTFVSLYAIEYAARFYTAGFILILVTFGFILALNGIILSRQIKKHEKRMKNEKVTKTVSKIRKLAFTLIFIIVAALLRDLAFLLKPAGLYDNIQHFSAFYTFVLETMQGVIVMIALADYPENYLLFKSVKSASHSSSGSGGGVNGGGSVDKDKDKINGNSGSGSAGIIPNGASGGSRSLTTNQKEDSIEMSSITYNDSSLEYSSAATLVYNNSQAQLTSSLSLSQSNNNITIQPTTSSTIIIDQDNNQIANVHNINNSDSQLLTITVGMTGDDDDLQNIDINTNNHNNDII